MAIKGRSGGTHVVVDDDLYQAPRSQHGYVRYTDNYQPKIHGSCSFIGCPSYVSYPTTGNALHVPQAT